MQRNQISFKSFSPQEWTISPLFIEFPAGYFSININLGCWIRLSEVVNSTLAIGWRCENYERKDKNQRRFLTSSTGIPFLKLCCADFVMNVDRPMWNGNIHHTCIVCARRNAHYPACFTFPYVYLRFIYITVYFFLGRLNAQLVTGICQSDHFYTQRGTDHLPQSNSSFWK